MVQLEVAVGLGVEGDFLRGLLFGLFVLAWWDDQRALLFALENFESVEVLNGLLLGLLLTGFDLFLFLFEDHLDLSDSHFLLLFFLLNFLNLFLQILVDFFDGSLLVSLVLLDFVLFLLELFHVLNSGLLESNLVVVLHLLVESLSGLIDLSLDSRNLFAEFLLLILQLFDKRIGL